MNDINERSTIQPEYVNMIPIQNHQNKSVTNTIKSKGINTTFMIDEVISDTISRLSRIDSPSKIQVVFETNSNAVVYAHKDMIRCIVRNLIINIIKFGTIGEVIKISSKVVENHVIVSVSNSGGDVTNSNFHSLLETDYNTNNFNKTDEIIARIELLICRQFAEENDTNLSVIFGDKQDTVITFSLPKGIMKVLNDRAKLFAANKSTVSTIYWHSGF
jgi:K+-sensing histidine kinase KdpD